MKSYKPPVFKVKHIDDMFTKHKLDISKSVLEALTYAYTNDVFEVDFLEVIISDVAKITLQTTIAEYENTLNKNIQIFESAEEYELCQQAIDLKNKIKEHLDSKAIEKLVMNRKKSKTKKVTKKKNG